MKLQANIWKRCKDNYAGFKKLEWSTFTAQKLSLVVRVWCNQLTVIYFKLEPAENSSVGKPEIDQYRAQNKNLFSRSVWCNQLSIIFFS